MVQTFRNFTPLVVPVPANGSHYIVLADSISDVDTDAGGGNGRWADNLEDRYGMTRVNRTYFSNGLGAQPWTTGAGGSFEGGTNAGVFVVQNCTLSVVTTVAPPTGLGTHELKVTATATVPAINFGGDTGAMRNNMLAGQTYTASAYVYLPSGHTFTGLFLILYDNDGSGALGTVGAANLATVNGWQRLSVTRTLRAGATSAFLRIETAGGAAAQFYYADGVMLQRGSVLSPYADWTTRSAIASTNLQSNDAATNNAVSTFATRITPWVTNGQLTAADYLFVEYGQNDRQYATSASGGPTPTTPATWTTAVNSILASYAALSPKPRLVWLGLPQNVAPYSVNASPCAPPPWAQGDDQICAALDAISGPLVTAAGGLFVPLRKTMDAAFMTGGSGAHPSLAGHAYIAERVARALEFGG